MTAIIINEQGERVELDECRAAIVPHSQPAIGEPVRVLEVIATDYIWNEEHKGFFPVFGAPHAGAPILVNETPEETRMTALARARHAAAGMIRKALPK